MQPCCIGHTHSIMADANKVEQESAEPVTTNAQTPSEEAPTPPATKAVEASSSASNSDSGEPTANPSQELYTTSTSEKKQNLFANFEGHQAEKSDAAVIPAYATQVCVCPAHTVLGRGSLTFGTGISWFRWLKTTHERLV